MKVSDPATSPALKSSFFSAKASFRVVAVRASSGREPPARVTVRRRGSEEIAPPESPKTPTRLSLPGKTGVGSTSTSAESSLAPRSSHSRALVFGREDRVDRDEARFELGEEGGGRTRGR